MSTSTKYPDLKRIILILLILSQLGYFAVGQNNLIRGTSSVFITGITYDSKTLEPLSNTRFKINSRKGFNVSESGSFSYNGTPGDTLYFSYIGYQPTRLIVPDTLKSAEYVMGVFMQPDTIKLAEIIILPRMNNSSIMISPVKDDQNTMNIAQSNVNKAVVEGLTKSPKVYDANMNAKKTMRTNQMRAEYSGMLVTPENSVGISTQSYRTFRILYGTPIVSSNTAEKMVITNNESTILLEHFEALKKLKQQTELKNDSIIVH
jgi:hypothetical protein